MNQRFTEFVTQISHQKESRWHFLPPYYRAALIWDRLLPHPDGRWATLRVTSTSPGWSYITMAIEEITIQSMTVGRTNIEEGIRMAHQLFALPDEELIELATRYIDVPRMEALL